MKNTFLVLIVCMYTSLSIAQDDVDVKISNQPKLGIYAGYVNLTAKAKVKGADFSSTSSEGGVTVGLSFNSRLSNELYIQPAVQYGYVEKESWLFIPLMLKYYITDQFNLMAGPQGTLYLEDTHGFPINTFGFDLSFGAGFDITEHIFIEGRYAFELTNRTSDLSETNFLDEGFDPIIQPIDIDITTKVSSLHIVLGYRF